MIEKAAKELCTTESMPQWKKDYGIFCFMDGARWRINSVWHKATEKPNGLFIILIEFGEEEFGLGVTSDDLKGARRWAYIIDLLPEGKEDGK